MADLNTEDRAIRLASIVSVDIAGFSSMSERDQRNAARKVENLRHRIETIATKHGGRLFNTAGDGFMLEFGSAGQAFAAIQDILDKRGRGEPPIRVGAHIGDVIVTATDDLLGHGVNVAARLQELAEPGSALVSAEFRSMARTSPTNFHAKGQKPLDNIEQRVQTFEILSRRQRFARFSRRVGWFGVGAAAIAGLVYVSPMAFTAAQNYVAEQQRAEAAAVATTESPAAPSEEVIQQAAAVGPVHAAGDIIRDCEQCPEMVVLPGGLFVMGSPANEAGRMRDEGPQREVSVAPFAIGKYEITFAQWDACLAGGGCNGYSPPDRGWGRGNRPVTDISWQDAQAYLDWLNAQTGAVRYRLASEAEWEYAARAGASTPYAFGARVTAAQARYRGRTTVPVGERAANAFGLFDVHGNVAEWVEDCYAGNYELAPVNGSAVQADECTRHVFRGGGYADQMTALRVALRKAARPEVRIQGVGFRVARALD